MGYDYPATMYIYPITKKWDPATTEWGNLALSCGASETSKELPRGTYGMITFDVTSLINDFIKGTIPNYGFMLSCTTSYTGSSNGQFSFFASSEYVAENRKPRLSVEYTGTSIMFTNSKLNNPLAIALNNNFITLYSINKYERCSVALYTISGELISLQKRGIEKGSNTIIFSQELASGCYICKVSTSNLHVTEKILIR